MKREYLRVILAIIVGIIIGLIIVFVLNTLISGKQDGCIVTPDNSTENAQGFLMGTIGGNYADPSLSFILYCMNSA